MKGSPEKTAVATDEKCLVQNLVLLLEDAGQYNISRVQLYCMFTMTWKGAALLLHLTPFRIMCANILIQGKIL
jgi:hypothetical protein